MSPKCNFWEPQQAKMDWKEKIRDLKQMFEEFLERNKNLQRGAGRFSAPPPFVGFFSDPKLFRQLLKVSYFFLSIHFGLQGLSKITFWGPWTYLTNNSHCKLRDLVALRGQKSKTTGTCESKVACKFSKKKSQKAWNHVLTL